MVFVHALAETFSILTGGRHGRRLRASAVARLFERSVLPFVEVRTLTGGETMTALAECESRGIRGGAVYDWLHLATARNSGAEAFVTLDLRDFRALTRPGDPRIEPP